MSICKVESFFDSLKNYKTIYNLEKRVKIEREYLEKACGSIASLKSYFTKYRKYLIANVSKDRFVEDKLLIDLLLKNLRLNGLQQNEFSKAQEDKMYNDRSNLRDFYDIDRYIEIAVGLLGAVSIYDNILGVAALTGRRTAEIGCSAVLSHVQGDKRSAIFDGQLKIKKSEAVKPYQIPLLYDFDAIAGTLAKIRKSKPEFVGKPSHFNSIASKELGIRVKKHFTGVFEGVPKAKDLRSIYALVCFTEFSKDVANRKTERGVYMSRILGHRLKDLVTYGSYLDFCLTK